MASDRIMQTVIEENWPFLKAAKYLQWCISNLEHGCRENDVYDLMIKLIAFCHGRTDTEEEKQRLCEQAERYVKFAQKASQTSRFLLDSIFWCWKETAYLADYPCGEWIFQYMAERGAGLNVTAPVGGAILHYIVRQYQKPHAERLSVLKILLENGAYPDYQDCRGKTPIYYATTPEEINILRKHYSLQCFAVNAIINKKISFNPEILGPIEKILDAHRRKTLTSLL